jgi:hypothetical protein
VGKTIEIKIGKSTFPVVSIAKTENEIIFVYRQGDKLFGLSTSKMIAPIRFHNARPMWGNKPISFI